MSSGVRVRGATAADAAVIAEHRARMFADLGRLPPETFEVLRAAAEFRLTEMLARGEYVGWLALPPGDERVIGGAGVQRRLVLPHPQPLADGRVEVAAGRHAIVVNVYTEPSWRRRGVGEALMRRVLDWAAAEGLDRLVLHASDQGRGLYERLGFVPTNEMRFVGSSRP
ncbi:MAG: GNAT family N-acetyltransferase [Gemmatimonadales bacterium]